MIMNFYFIYNIMERRIREMYLFVMNIHISKRLYFNLSKIKNVIYFINIYIFTYFLFIFICLFILWHSSTYINTFVNLLIEPVINQISANKLARAGFLRSVCESEWKLLRVNRNLTSPVFKVE